MSEKILWKFFCQSTKIVELQIVKLKQTHQLKQNRQTKRHNRGKVKILKANQFNQGEKIKSCRALFMGTAFLVSRYGSKSSGFATPTIKSWKGKRSACFFK